MSNTAILLSAASLAALLAVKIAYRRHSEKHPKITPPKPIRFDIPEEHKMEVCKLYDQVEEARKTGLSFRTKRLEYCNFVNSIIKKETKATGRWELLFDSQNPYVQFDSVNDTTN